MIRLKLKRQPKVPLQADRLSPDGLSGLSHDAICTIEILHGRRRCRVDEFFEVQGEGADELQIEGDLRKVQQIGSGMTHGTIAIRGDVGIHLGASMSGGKITVDGDAGDWAGAEMVGGEIHIGGNAGDRIGGAYVGSLTGMKNGTILVGGTAGAEIGLRMRRGLIVVGGQAGELAGLQMKGGTIVLRGGAAARCGAWMRRGTIVSLQPVATLATHHYSTDYNPTFLNLYARHLQGFGIEIPYRSEEGGYARYCGDGSVRGKGEILVWQPRDASV
ncbi:formylmethanofuran dehydrogenase subunit C [Rosistilla oblonga]|uniref:formylmethanofuran dehydrogenase subunit C n=1 Tax=Rosistilla oblonga TaxID=2527990 RepID=UPI003A9713F7